MRRRESDGDEPAAERSSLLRAFADWHDPIPELVAATPPDAIIRRRGSTQTSQPAERTISRSQRLA